MVMCVLGGGCPVLQEEERERIRLEKLKQAPPQSVPGQVWLPLRTSVHIEPHSPSPVVMTFFWGKLPIPGGQSVDH